ncbi:hypothetical protein GGX14DRAFT_455568 [Mycena pura]|uniref:Uncharacterized protein n=1 Tax=Mycena pura TaxID=153505 RepID=A0AAD6VHR6_9AGAR|nr:hypothetical protein GGX14DRAFT_455568 [Mycena pura]
MSLTFAHPVHLAGYTHPGSGSLTLVGADEQNLNPHNVPVYDEKKSAPVLYLPPLLSSLPANFPSTPSPSENPPVITATRLPDIDPASLSLHKALHYFRPYDENYAAKPYSEAFNWDELVLPEHEGRDWYCVVFRSRRTAGSDGTWLLLYWYGIPNQESGLNLATCIWQSRKHAIAANSRPHHIQAMKLAVASYDVYDLERYVLRKVVGSTGVTIEPFTGGDVGW